MTDLSGVAGGLIGAVGSSVSGLVGHVVQTGETLAGIAATHGVSVGALLQANPSILHPDLVSPGAELTLPGRVSGPASPTGVVAGGAGTPVGRSARAGEPLLNASQATVTSVATRSASPVTAAVAQVLSPQPAGPASLAPVGGLIGTGGASSAAAQAASPLTAAPARVLPAESARAMPLNGAPVAEGRTASATVGATVTATDRGGTPGTAATLAAPSPSSAATGLIGSPGGPADWRLLSQVLSGAALVTAPPSGVPAPALTLLLRALAPVDPLLAQLLALGGKGLVLAQVAARMAEPLAASGWTTVAAGAARPGDLVLSPAPTGVRTETFVWGAAPDPQALVLRPPEGAVPGVDLPGARRTAGEARPSSKRSRDDGAGSSGEAETAQRRWIDRALAGAQAAKARWGVPIAVTLAQGALASDWGRIAPGNDFFGLLRAGGGLPALRGRGHAGFEGVDEAADAWGERLRAEPAHGRAFRTADPAEFVRRLADSGAAWSAGWAKTMQAVIDVNGLAAFDG